MVRWLIGYLLLLCGGASCAINAAPLKVAVAANFKPVLKQLTPLFVSQHNIKLSVSSASTGILYAQIRHGAPFDVFLSADAKRPELLVKENLTLSQTPKTYAIGQLVLWHRDSGLLETAVPDEKLLRSWTGKIALANAKTAPYGLAAKSVLQHLALWQDKQSQLVTGSNIAQTQQFMVSGNVELGFVGLSQVKGQIKGQIKGQVKGQVNQYWHLPTAWYPPLNQQVVILKRSKQQAHAKTFVNWLLSAKIQQHIIQAGFTSAR
ncbi:MAG: molybdate transport system substrate-binding protein [Phenylobacterium sp.]|jgi:molybdate transport system substrate-binding protein